MDNNVTLINSSNSTPAGSLLFTPGIPLLISRIILFTLCILAILLNLLILFALAIQASRHPNVRLITGNISGAAMVYAGAFFVKCVYFFLNRERLDGFVVTRLICSLQELPAGTAVRVATFTIVGVAVERLYATHNHATYEHKSLLAGMVFVVIAWLQGFGLTFMGTIDLLSRMDVANCTVDYCVSLGAVNNLLLGSSVIYLLICTIASIGVLYKVYKLNLRLMDRFRTNKLDLTISSRLQLKHSIETTLCLFPCIIAHATIRGCNQIYYLTLVFSVKDASLQTKAELGSIAEVVVACYFVAHPVVLIAYSTDIQKKLVSGILAKIPLPFCRRFVSNWRRRHPAEMGACGEEETIVESSAYFHQLSSYWEETNIAVRGKAKYTMDDSSRPSSAKPPKTNKVANLPMRQSLSNIVLNV